MSEKKIGTTGAVILIAFAGTCDFIGFIFGLIPFVGWIIDMFFDVCVGMTISIWLDHYNISVMKKRPGAFIFTLLLKMIPVLELLPDWTFFVMTTISQNRLHAIEGKTSE